MTQYYVSAEQTMTTLSNRLVLSSTQAVPDTSRYAVGILDANEFHLTPVDAVLSLRPSFDYLDKSDKTAKSEGRLLGMDTEEEEDIPASGSDAKVGDKPLIFEDYQIESANVLANP